MKLKKFICLLIAVAVAAECLIFSVSADTSVTDTDYPQLSKSPYEYKEQEETLAEATDVEELRQYLLKFIKKAESHIDLTSLSISQQLYTNLSDLIWYGMPEAFNVDGISFTLYDGMITEIIISYRSFADTEQEYKKCFNEFEAAADRLLYGIEGNKALSDEYKALLLHDRLCGYIQYCYEELGGTEYTAYGAFVNRSAVCQGYTMAYMYLLRRVGIDNYYCASQSLDHAWNIVYIDDIPYHVDVTRDDIDWGYGQRGVAGGVRHDNFLRSTEGLFNSDHRAYDYDDTPEDTKYDEYFWQESEAEFQLVGGKIYYINNKTGKLMCLTDKKELADIERIWYSGQFSYWNGNFSRLSSAGGELYYSLDDGVYKYTISNGKTKKIYAPELKSGFNVFGFTVEDEYIVCDINNEPPGGNVSQLSRKKIKLDVPAAVMTGIEIVASDEKAYYIGDSFDSKGITVKAVFSDGSKKALSDGLKFSGFSSEKAGTKTVTVTYKDFSAQVKVKVKSPSVTFNQTEIKISDNESVTPEIITKPTGQAVLLKSSSDAVIVKDGKIIGSKSGKAVVTAEITYKGKTYKDSVSVTVVCSHSDTTEHKKIPATTESVGYTKGVYCNNCKKYISGHKEIPKIEMKFTDSKKAKLDGDLIKLVAGVDSSEVIALAPEGSYLKDASGNVLKDAPKDTEAGTGFVLVFPDKSEYTIVAYGDVDGDGTVTSTDARLALRTAVGLEDYEKESPRYIAARVESNDILSAADARRILRGAVGLERPEEWMK